MFGALVFATAANASAQEYISPNGLPSRDIVFGIYLGDTASDCCWLGADAAIRVRPPADAKALLVNIFIPDFAIQQKQQQLHVQIGSNPEQTTTPLSTGEHELAFALPKRATASPLVVHISPAYTFVPAQTGINADPRHLSVLVRAIGFDTPESEQNGTPVIGAPLLPRPALFALLALSGIALLLVTLWRPVYGLCGLILTDPFLLPVYVHGTTLTLPKVALVAVAFGLLPRVASLKSLLRDRVLQILFVAQLAFIATMVISSIHAYSHSAALRETLKATQYAATLLVAYAAYRLDPGERAVRLALVTLAFVVLVPALLQERIGAPQAEMVAGRTVQRIAGALDGPNQLAGFLGVIVPVLAAFWSLRTRIAAETLAIVLGILGCLLTLSRGGIVGLTAGLLCVAGANFVRARRGAITAVFGVYGIVSVLAFFVFAGAAPHAVAATFGAGGHDFNNGLGSRLDLWQGAYAMWKAHPLFGVGPGNFELTIGQFTPGLHTHANGMFFQTLAEQGVLGLLPFLAITAASVGVFLRKLDNPLALGAIGASTALAFHQITDCIVIYPKVGVIWWIILGVAAASVGLTRSYDDEAVT